MVWGTLVAIYLFMAGIAAGAYLLGTMIETFWPDQGLKNIRRWAFYLSVPMVGLSSVFLILDAEAGLHNPLRLFYVVANFPNSMMSVGTLIITGFQLITLIAAWKAMSVGNEPQSPCLRIIGSLFAVGLTVYTGLLLGVSSAIPFWNNSILPVLFTVSAISTGFAAAVLLGVYFKRSEAAQLLPIKKVHLALLFCEMFLIFTLLYTSSQANVASAQSVAKLVSGNLAGFFWIGLVAIGLVLPAAIEIYELKSSAGKPEGPSALNSGSGVSQTAATLEEPKQSLGLLALSEGAVLTGGFLLRYLILAAGVYVSVF
jgi:formate-dependent nitrite reductase membrane component NrfD